MSLTAAQKKAIATRGNVLLAAGAGTGKTKTLVERCLHWMLDHSPPLSLAQVVMVTFTDAAGAEIRKRIRQELEARLESSSGAGRQSASQAHLREELALFDSAHIGTLHRFCFQLVRQYFYELEIDPQATVMAEEEAW